METSLNRKARHSALTDLANMILPSLMEDIKSEDSGKSSPEDAKKMMSHKEECECEEDDKEEKKPRIVGLSLTRIMGAQSNNKAQESKSKNSGKKK